MGGPCATATGSPDQELAASKGCSRDSTAAALPDEVLRTRGRRTGRDGVPLHAAEDEQTDESEHRDEAPRLQMRSFAGLEQPADGGGHWVERAHVGVPRFDELGCETLHASEVILRRWRPGHA